MSEIDDRSNAAIRPPIALALAIAGGLVLQWLLPLPFLPPSPALRAAGIAIAATALGIAASAIVTLRRAGTHVETYKPTTAIVASGPYRLTRNPIYAAMLGLLAGLAIALDNAWLVIALLPFYAVLRYGVIAREEAYLEGKFGDAYRSYKASVRRWV